jgi:hypothetical protein
MIRVRPVEGMGRMPMLLFWQRMNPDLRFAFDEAIGAIVVEDR